MLQQQQKTNNISLPKRKSLLLNYCGANTFSENKVCILLIDWYSGF